MLNRTHLMNTISYENYCLKAKLQELLEKIAKLQEEMLQYNASPNKPSEIDQTNEEINEYKETINKRDIEIVYLKEMITTLTANIPPEKEEIDVEQLNKLQEQIAQYESTIQKNASDMAELCDEVNKLKCVIFLYESQITELTNAITTKDQTIASRDADIEQLKIILAGKEAELAHLRR